MPPVSHIFEYEKEINILVYPYFYRLYFIFPAGRSNCSSRRAGSLVWADASLSAAICDFIQYPDLLWFYRISCKTSLSASTSDLTSQQKWLFCAAVRFSVRLSDGKQKLCWNAQMRAVRISGSRNTVYGDKQHQSCIYQQLYSLPGTSYAFPDTTQLSGNIFAASHCR